MMFDNKKTNNKKLTFAIIITATLLCIGLAYILIKQAGSKEQVGGSTSEINYNPPTSEEIKTGETIKQDKTTSSSNETSSDNPTPNPSSNTEVTKTRANMDITAANQTGETLVVRIIIQTVTSSGICTLDMKGPNGKTFSQSANVQALSSSSTCQGFNIPINSLSSGPWTITVSFSNESTIASTSKEVTIQ